MAHQKVEDGFLYLIFRRIPWWASFAVVTAIYIVLRYVLPTLLRGSPTFALLGMISITFAPWLALFALFLAILAEWHKHQRRALLDRQSSLETIRAMSWQQFELLVGEAYRRQGYRVKETGGSGPDGGVDLILRRDQETVLVQCKRWKQARVGAPTVRELRGAVARDGATRGVFVTSGAFTEEAKAEAQGQPLELVDGSALLELVKQVQGQKAIAQSLPAVVEPTSAAPPTCPLCQTIIVLRTARKGVNAGEQFWGCPDFPHCRGTRQI